MNIKLKPDTLWVFNERGSARCYRINDSQTEVSALQEHNLYENEITYNEDPEEDEADDCEILTVGNNRFYSNCHIASNYLGCVIGKKGAMRSRIERDTGTVIKIPKIGENKDVVIYGTSPANIKAARRRINSIVMSTRMKHRPTHFLSIPFNDANIMRNFENFKTLVLKECSGRGLEESLFIRPEKLHMTLGVTCLMDNVERLQASKLLSEAKSTIIMPMIQDYMPLKIRLQGISYMNDDPKEIHVLYGCVQEVEAPTGLLQRLADSVAGHFKKSGFLKQELGRDNVKMHVTFLNTKYRGRSGDASDEEDQSEAVAKKCRESFDGSEILRKFSDYDFGVAELREMHLSQRNALGPDGYYQATCIISFNLSE